MSAKNIRAEIKFKEPGSEVGIKKTTDQVGSLTLAKTKPNRPKQVNFKREAKMKGKNIYMKDLQPKCLSTTSSLLRNEPMLNDGSLVEGLCGATQLNMSKHFSLNFSQYLEVVETSYAQQISKDRGLAKQLSRSMFTCYCIILLLKRIFRILSVRHL